MGLFDWLTHPMVGQKTERMHYCAFDLITFEVDMYEYATKLIIPKKYGHSFMIEVTEYSDDTCLLEIGHTIGYGGYFTIFSTTLNCFDCDKINYFVQTTMKDYAAKTQESYRKSAISHRELYLKLDIQKEYSKRLSDCLQRGKANDKQS